MRRTLMALGATAALAGALPAQANAAPFEVGHIPKCTELVPAAVSVDSTPITLSVRVLLDGTSLARAQAVMAEAARSYSPLGITLSATYEAVSFSGTDASSLNDQARARFGGARPPGADVVYTFTSKDITEGAVGTSVAGLADCIGGVAFADRAFAVGEDLPDRPQTILVIRRGVASAARVAGHEIGHLMGAHHHYANCVENFLTALAGDNLCTLMFNEVSFTGLRFSALNSLVVRGHAQRYAAP